MRLCSFTGRSVLRSPIRSFAVKVPEGQIVDVNDEELLQMVSESKDPIILDCHAGWCRPCKILGPMLEAEVKKTKNVRLAKLDVDTNERVPDMLKVNAIPAVFAYYNGRVIAAFTGVPPAENLATWVSNVSNPEELLKD